MAIEKAKELIKKLEEDEALRAVFQADPRAALAAGDYGCTFEEFKEAGVMNRELDDAEMDAVSGGGMGADHPGGCTRSYWAQECSATVEAGSWCSSNDWCQTWDVQYGGQVVIKECYVNAYGGDIIEG